ncbi:MAG: hypothetical protein AAF234_20160 [Pseudomonadota bacterium]
MLTPMYKCQDNRPVEYGMLATFGLAFTLQYFVQALHGASPVKVRCFIGWPRIRWPEDANPLIIKTSRGNLTLFETV